MPLTSRPDGPKESAEPAPPAIIRVIAFDSARHLETSLDEPHKLRELQGAWPVLWVDVEGGCDERVVLEIGEIFGLHPLAIEDVLHLQQRPKIEQYEQHHFIVAHMVLAGAGEVQTEQVSLFLGRNFVVTFQQGAPGDCFDAVRRRIAAGKGRLRHAGPDHLAYALLDAVIDSYFPELERMGERLEVLEDAILERPSRRLFQEIHDAKRGMMILRRAIWPLRDALHSLIREEMPLIREETRPYLRDCYDHTVRIIDFLEVYRELGADLRDLYLSAVSHRLNEVMKVLTVIATIFIPLTFICSVYGMNFNPDQSPLNMPELNWYYGYPFALALMAVTTLIMLAVFWWKGWFSADGAEMNPTQRERE